jgi:hypothetical protein
MKDRRGYTLRAKLAQHPKLSHASRIRKTREAASAPPTGVGSQIQDSKMIEAAGYWLDQEKESSNGKVSALAVGKSLQLSEAPEWLESDHFRRFLEVERFKRRILELRARPEISAAIAELISLGLLEAQKRLVMEAEDIPATVLYGDILHKWPKMLREFEQGQAPVKAGDVFVSIVREINLIQDIGTRDKLKKQILGEYERAALALSPSVTVESVSPDESDSPNSVPVDRGQLDLEPRPSDQPGQTTEVPHRDSFAQPSGRLPEEQLWSDPAVD